MPPSRAASQKLRPEGAGVRAADGRVANAAPAPIRAGGVAEGEHLALGRGHPVPRPLGRRGDPTTGPAGGEPAGEPKKPASPKPNRPLSEATSE